MRQILSAHRLFTVKCHSLPFRIKNQSMEDVLKNIFLAAVDSVKPSELISKNKLLTYNKSENKEIIEISLKELRYKLNISEKKIHVVGFGKGVLAIGKCLESVLGDRITSGILSVPIGALKQESLSENSRIIVIEGAAGNLPDHASHRAAIEIKNYVSTLTQDDILFCLITGGGSALLPLPTEPVTLDEKSNLIKQLSKAGATINELNIVRIALSQLKGGKLASVFAKNAHKIISLIISDIINDPLELIASGPTIQFQKPTISPQKILEKYNLIGTLPPSIAELIQKNEENQDAQSVIKNSQVFLIANNRVAIDAAMNKAKLYNLVPVFLSAEVQGNVIDISEAFFGLASLIRKVSVLSRDDFIQSIENTLRVLHAQPKFVEDLIDAFDRSSTTGCGICIISGGEPTVTVKGNGLGGRNQELALRFTKLCHDHDEMTSEFNDLLLLSAGTDGIDGNNDAAGAIGGLKILSNLNETNISDVMTEYIFGNDSYSFYKNFLKKYAGDRYHSYHIHTGITGTNIMDIHLLMIMPNARLS